MNSEELKVFIEKVIIEAEKKKDIDLMYSYGFLIGSFQNILFMLELKDKYNSDKKSLDDKV